MRKELNFQSGTDAESSLKLDLNSVIAELTESVTNRGLKPIVVVRQRKRTREIGGVSKGC